MRKFLTILSIPIFLISCLESPEERQRRLSELLDQGKVTEVLTEIDELFEEMGEQNSIVLSKNEGKRIIHRSLDGSTVVWLEGNELRSVRGEKTESIGVPKRRYTDMQLSYSGQSAVLTYPTEKKCKMIVVVISENEVYDENSPETNCENVSTPTDGEPFVHFGSDKGVDHWNYMNDQRPSPQALPASQFQKKYKVTQRYAIVDLPGPAYTVFYGAGGYYNMYLVSGFGKFQSMGGDFARPVIYGSVEQKVIFDDADENDKIKTRPIGHIYSGVSGKYKLRALYWKDPPTLDSGIPAHPYYFLNYVYKREGFLISKKQGLTVWFPNENKFTYLPLVTEEFEAFNDGIVYEDLEGRLLLRKNAFTEDERQLLMIRMKAMDAKKEEDGEE